MLPSKTNLLGGALLLLAAPAAMAQPVGQFLLDRYFPEGIPGYYTEPGVTVLSRVRPDYDPPGVRAGSFIIRPEAAEAVGYNDNVLGDPANRQASAVVDTRASLSAASDWGRDSLAASVSVNDTRYPSLANQNTTVWSGSLGGTLDVGRDQAQVGATHLSAYQLPSGIDSRGITAPAPFDLDNVHAGYAAQFGRFSVLPRFDYTQLRFSPANFGAGPQQSQSFNNRNIYTGVLEGRYEFFPQNNAVLEFRAVGTDYVSATAAVPTQNSTGYAVRAGIDYAADGLWRFRALIGYELRDFQSPAYAQRSAPVGEANVIWTPTGLTTVTARAARTIEDSNTTTVSGYDYTSALLTVDHEYVRNILLRFYTGYQHADYVGTSASETFYLFGLGATWLVGRDVRLGVSYNFVDHGGDNGGQPLTSPVRGGTYLQNIMLLQVRFQL